MSTKITKVKTGELKSPIKKEPSTPSTVEEKHPASPSTEDEFCGFESSTLNEEQKKKQDALLRILDELNASCSLAEEGEEAENEVEKDSEDVEENGVDEDMTVDTDHVSDADSDQMEIDVEKDKDSIVVSDSPQEKTKDSDVESVKSAGDNISKSDNSDIKPTMTDANEETEVRAPETTLKGSGAKVEFCGTCDAEVNDSEEGICCDGDCERWFHLRCSGLTQAEYDELGLDENAKWACSRCSGVPPRSTANAKPLVTVRKDLGQFSTPSPLLLTKKRSGNREGRSPRIDIANPAFLKPFDFGWKRELVYRSTNDNQNRRQGDIYYYTPKGKKLRSLREISDYLAGTDLTQDNFTFWKEPLGVDDPDKEIIRDAKFKLVNKDPNASPGVISKKPITPKTQKTPKVLPKLTATVSPLDTSGSMKASASVTPRVVLKGKASPAAGPKFKVTPSKTTTPGQPQKIVISKGEESVDYSQKIESVTETMSSVGVKAVTRSSNPGPEELLEMSKRNKFKRYGLLANAKTARKRVMRSTLSSRSSSSEGSGDSDAEGCTTLTLAKKRGSNSKVKTTSGQKKREESKNQSKKKVHPILPQSNPSNQIPFSLIPDKYLSQNLLSRRPSPPEIQFRPSNPSSYGCQTSSSLTPRMCGPSVAQFQSNSTSVFETVLIVDTAETFIGSPNSGEDQLVLNNSDSSIDIVSVESLHSNSDGGSLPLNQSTLTNDGNIVTITRNKNLSSVFLSSGEMNSPISLGSSSTEEIVIEDDDVPPFLQRTSPRPRPRKNSSSPSRSPPSLQRIPTPPPLVFAGTTAKPTAPVFNYSKPPCLSSGLKNKPVKEEESSTRETGSSHFDYRTLKKKRLLKKIQRIQMQQKAKREMLKMKKAYFKEKKLVNRKKYQEKALQVKYLNLKVKDKELKIALKQKNLDAVGR